MCVQCQCVIIPVCVEYLLAVHTECAGNELHGNIMTAFHLIPSTPRALEDDGNLDRMFGGLGFSPLSPVLCNIKARLERERMAVY